jgi:UrcA family protein
MKISAWVLALVVLMPAFVFASAKTPERSYLKRSTTIRYDDLDLARDSDVAALYERLHRGARRVCSDFEASSSLSLEQMFNDCVNASLARAITDLGHPGLTAYAQNRFTATRMNRRLAVSPLVNCSTAHTVCE